MSLYIPNQFCSVDMFFLFSSIMCHITLKRSTFSYKINTYIARYLHCTSQGVVASYTTLWEFVMMCIESEYLVAWQVTTIDQQTTVVGKEPLQKLKTFRAGPQLSNIHAMRNGVSFIPVNIWMSFI